MFFSHRWLFEYYYLGPTAYLYGSSTVGKINIFNLILWHIRIKIIWIIGIIEILSDEKVDEEPEKEYTPQILEKDNTKKWVKYLFYLNTLLKFSFFIDNIIF